MYVHSQSTSYTSVHFCLKLHVVLTQTLLGLDRDESYFRFSAEPLWGSPTSPSWVQMIMDRLFKCWLNIWGSNYFEYTYMRYVIASSSHMTTVDNVVRCADASTARSSINFHSRSGWSL